MGINVASSFTRNAGVPIDDTAIVADLTARDAIADGIRYEGFIVYVEAEGLNYQLVGGITDSDWVEIGGGGGGGAYVVTGSRGTPTDVEAATAITLTPDVARQLQYIQGDGGHIEVSANPQIPVGTVDGQELTLIGRNNDQTVTYFNGTGLYLKSDSITLGENDIANFVWDTSVWVLQSKNF